MSTIGEAMRQRRHERGLTALVVGRMVGAREGQISDWERGKVDPGPDVRRRYFGAGLLTAEEALLPFRAEDAA